MYMPGVDVLTGGQQEAGVEQWRTPVSPDQRIADLVNPGRAHHDEQQRWVSVSGDVENGEHRLRYPIPDSPRPSAMNTNCK